jgi:hypothetical protein
VWISRVKSGVFFCLRHHGNRHPHICASLPCSLKYVTNSSYITSMYSASDVWVCVDTNHRGLKITLPSLPPCLKSVKSTVHMKHHQHNATIGVPLILKRSYAPVYLLFCICHSTLDTGLQLKVQKAYLERYT